MLRHTEQSQIQAVLDLAMRVARRQGAGDVAADIAQEVVVIYLTGEARPADNWEAWVTTVTKNKVIDHARREARAPSAIDDEDDSKAYGRKRFELGPSAQANTRVIVEGLLKGISDRDRRMLELDALNNTNEEIAQAVGLANANVVAVTLSRIKKRLRERYPDLVDDVEDPRVY